MTRLDDYRSAMLAAFPEVPETVLAQTLDKTGRDFARLVVELGLGPLWHDRTGRDEFHQSRLTAEALYAAQEHAVDQVSSGLEDAGIRFAVIKGAANRCLLYENPALRACHDLDFLVHRDDRVRAASALVELGFQALPENRSISRELVLTRGAAIVDLHWGLLREGRLRSDPVPAMLERRRSVGDLWMLGEEDALFVLLVHPAFAKHLGAWDMGLHRVADIAAWLRTQPFEWRTVEDSLAEYGVRGAAWVTLRWVQLLAGEYAPEGLQSMLSDIQPGRLRKAWLNLWLENDLSERTSGAHRARLLGFSLLIHDSAGDAARAIRGRRRARRRESEDLAAFARLLGQ
jgi:hypothetical protein